MIKSVLDTIEPPRYVIFLGGGCSLATEPTAALSGAFYHVVQVSREKRLLRSVSLIPLPPSLFLFVSFRSHLAPPPRFCLSGKTIHFSFAQFRPRPCPTAFVLHS